jgi:hypothetical protein
MWYILQLAIIVWAVNFFTDLGTHASKFAIYLLALLAAYMATIILTLMIDLLRRILWWLSHPILGTYALLGQERRHNPRIHISKHPLTGRRLKYRIDHGRN